MARLRIIFWELTSQCNLNCIHCRGGKTGEVKDELTTREAIDFIDLLVKIACPLIIFSGGEPLLRSDIFLIVREAKDKGLNVALATNGTLIDRRLALRIFGSGIKRVAVSLDGASAETHDRFRALSGSFDRAILGFNYLKPLGMEMQINTTVTKNNLEELPHILELSLRLGARAWHIFLLVPVGCGLEIAQEQQLMPAQYEQTLRWLYHQSQKINLELKATCAPHYNRIVHQRRKNKEKFVWSPEGRGCLAGSSVCFISSQGEVQPCGYFPLSAGNIRGEDFGKIWETSPLFLQLRDPKLLKGKCGHCHYRDICYGCRARALAHTGDYLEEEPFCIYQPKRDKNNYQ